MSTMLDLTKNRYSSQWRAENAKDSDTRLDVEVHAYEHGRFIGKLSVDQFMREVKSSRSDSLQSVIDKANKEQERLKTGMSYKAEYLVKKKR
jgi:hypothetical protein